jgi:hypothetical protein
LGALDLEDDNLLIKFSYIDSLYPNKIKGEIMDNNSFQLELAAFDEKITLAELEESKAAERVQEFKYEKARFILQCLSISMKKTQVKPSPEPIPTQPETRI